MIMKLAIELAVVGGITTVLIQRIKNNPYSYLNILLAGGLFYGIASFVMTFFFHWEKRITVTPRGFLVVVIPIILVICLLVTITNVTLIRREGMSFRYLLGGLLFIFFGLVYSPLIVTRSWGMNEKICLYFEMFMCYVICLFAGVCMMGYICACRKVAYDKDFVIVLGCSISKQGGLRPLLKSRTNRAIRFAWDQERSTGKSIQYIPSGGQGRDEIISEGSAMELYIVAHGAEFYEVYPEKKSRNTYENFLFSKKIINLIDKNAKTAFVTNNYHVLRSGMLSKAAGLESEGVGCETIWYFWPNEFVREFFAILVMGAKIHLILAGIWTILWAIYYFAF